MNDFINPKSMLTPGIAGSLLMFLVNGIAYQFPEIPVRYLALFLSFLIGAIVWASEIKGRLPVMQKTIYWILNSLIIFVVGFGTTRLAADAISGTSKVATPYVRLFPVASTALAQDTSRRDAASSVSNQATPDSQNQQKELEKKLADEQAENKRLKIQLESIKKSQPVPQPDVERNFFKRW